MPLPCVWLAEQLDGGGGLPKFSLQMMRTRSITADSNRRIRCKTSQASSSLRLTTLPHLRGKSLGQYTHLLSHTLSLSHTHTLSLSFSHTLSLTHALSLAHSLSHAHTLAHNVGELIAIICRDLAHDQRSCAGRPSSSRALLYILRSIIHRSGCKGIWPTVESHV